MPRTIAAEERFRRGGWFPLIGGALLNLVGAGVVWGTTHSPGAGWFGLASGVAVSQIQFHTQPTAAMAAWEAYTRGHDPARAGAAGPRVVVVPNGVGLAVQGSF